MRTTPPGVTLINAQTNEREFTSVRILGTRIAALDEDPRPGDSIVDLEGDRVLPGLINAHDHLQLNSLPRPAFEKSYRHVREWIADVDASRRSDPEFAASVAVARDERLLIGGVKNLLSGVTTVAHHDPLYPFLSNARYPTRVVCNYGWAHSLYVAGEETVADSYRATPSRWPWIIHAAEGLDHEAALEFERLDALGCIAPNTLLVHGIALSRPQRMRLHLAAADVAELAAQGRVALGTDSRLSGIGDLLDELRLVGQLGVVDDRSLQSLVTSASARLLRLRDRGELRARSRADILILPARTRLATARRADVRLVLVDGIVRYGDRDCAERVAPHGEWTDIRVDGRPKILDAQIAKLLSHAATSEIGLELSNLAGKAA
jgi:cytosine/adenosine deaminase-related metal-dependent hydrolase